MAIPSPHKLPSPIGREPSFAVKVIATFTAFLVVLGVVASVAVFLVRSQMERAIEKLEDRTGRQITVGSLDISLIEGLAVRNVSMTKPNSNELHLRVALIQTDLSFLDLLSGKKRPNELTLRGLEARLGLTRHGMRDFDDIIRRNKKPKKPTKPRSPLKVSISESKVILGLQLPGLSPREVTIEDIVARVQVGGAKGFELKGKGDVRVDAQKRKLAFDIDTNKGGLFRAELDSPILIPLSRRRNRMLLKVQGLTRSKATGATTLLGLGFQTKDVDVSLGSLRVNDGGGQYLPKLSNIKDASVRSIKVVSGEMELNVASLEVGFDEGKRLHPNRVTASEVIGTIKNRRIHARLAKLDVGLRGSLVNAWLNKRPLDAVGSISIERPFLRIPTADKLIARLPGLKLLEKSTNELDRETANHEEGSEALQGVRKQVFDKLRSMPLVVNGGRVLAVDEQANPIMEFTDVDLSVRHSGKTGLQVGVDARLVRKSNPAGKFSVRGTFSDEGDLEVVTGIVRGKDIAHFVSGFSEYLSVDRDSEVEMEFAYTPPSNARPIHRLRVIKAKAKNFGFQAWRVSHSEVGGIDGETSFVAEYDPKKRHLNVQVPSLVIGKAKLQGSLDLTQPKRAKPRVALRLKMKRQDCAQVAASIPRVLIPRLKGIKVAGTMTLDASMKVDLENPKTLKLKIDGDVESCQIHSLGSEIKIDDLKAKLYEHHPIEPERGRLAHITVGPGTPEWVPSHMLPTFVKAAAVVTEDRSFYSHKGVRWDLIGRALRMDVRKGRFVYGGSTITQQLVKNLYLTREKTLARKLEELIISGQMERKLTKDEILTLYVNMIEFGPDIYGVKRAARFYFAKEPWHLSPLEAAFIMGLKPYPKSGYAQWERQSLNSWWIKRVVHVMDMVRRREGAISKLEFKAAAPYQPRFRKPQESTFSGRRYARPTTLPPNLLPNPVP